MRKNPLLLFRAYLSADCRTLAKGRKEDFVPIGGAARAMDVFCINNSVEEAIK
jgi:hypothetical protein